MVFWGDFSDICTSAQVYTSSPTVLVVVEIGFRAQGRYQLLHAGDEHKKVPFEAKWKT